MKRGRAGDERLKDMVLYLYAVNRTPQMDIASQLGLSETDVSKTLRNARDEGLVKEQVTIELGRRFTPEYQDGIRKDIEARNWDDQEALKRKLKEVASLTKSVPVRDVHVFFSLKAASSKDPDQWDEAAVAFGKAAARHLLGRLTDADLAAVSSGRTLAGLIRALRDLLVDPPRRGDNPVRVFPAWGEPLGEAKPKSDSKIFKDYAELSSTRLATGLSEVLNGTADGVPSLLASPAIIPVRFQGEEVECIKEFVHVNEAYKAIFGDFTHGPRLGATTEGKAPLIEQADTMLLSVGSPDQPGRFWSDAVMRYAGISHEELKDLGVGDLGGCLIAHPDLPEAKKEQLQGLIERWMGVTEVQIRECARRADQSRKRPGVIVLGVGPSRGRIVSECATRGLINELIIDHSLAESLKEKLDEKIDVLRRQGPSGLRR